MNESLEENLLKLTVDNFQSTVEQLIDYFHDIKKEEKLSFIFYTWLKYWLKSDVGHYEKKFENYPSIDYGEKLTNLTEALFYKVVDQLKKNRIRTSVIVEDKKRTHPEDGEEENKHKKRKTAENIIEITDDMKKIEERFFKIITFKFKNANEEEQKDNKQLTKEIQQEGSLIRKTFFSYDHKTPNVLKFLKNGYLANNVDILKDYESHRNDGICYKDNPISEMNFWKEGFETKKKLSKLIISAEDVMEEVEGLDFEKIKSVSDPLRKVFDQFTEIPYHFDDKEFDDEIINVIEKYFLVKIPSINRYDPDSVKITKHLFDSYNEFVNEFCYRNFDNPELQWLNFKKSEGFCVYESKETITRLFEDDQKSEFDDDDFKEQLKKIRIEKYDEKLIESFKQSNKLLYNGLVFIRDYYEEDMVSHFYLNLDLFLMFEQFFLHNAYYHDKLFFLLKKCIQNFFQNYYKIFYDNFENKLNIAIAVIEMSSNDISKNYKFPFRSTAKLQLILEEILMEQARKFSRFPLSPIISYFKYYIHGDPHGYGISNGIRNYDCHFIHILYALYFRRNEKMKLYKKNHEVYLHFYARFVDVRILLYSFSDIFEFKQKGSWNFQPCMVLVLFAGKRGLSRYYACLEINVNITNQLKIKFS